jgi:hypothetical protein
MKRRTKEVILKTLIVMGITFMVLPIFFIIVVELYPKYKDFIELLIVIDGILFFVSGSTLMILLPIFGLELKPQKAEKIDLAYNHYQEFLEDISIKATEKGYHKQESEVKSDQFSFDIFLRKKLSMLETIYIIGIDELSKDNLSLVYEKYEEFLRNIYGEKTITDKISVIIVICVEKDSKAFHQFLNSNIIQTFKFFQLPVGISFMTKQFFIARQKDGYAIYQYKKLRKQFLNVISK